MPCARAMDTSMENCTTLNTCRLKRYAACCHVLCLMRLSTRRMLPRPRGTSLAPHNHNTSPALPWLRTPPHTSPGRPAPPPAGAAAGAAGRRCSGRLAGQDAVVYNERALELAGLDTSSYENMPKARRASHGGCLPEATRCVEEYGPEHVAALGSTEREWELFVDGYCPETGKRVRASIV